MFAKKEPEQLRQRLAQLDRDTKLGHVTSTIALQQKVIDFIFSTSFNDLLSFNFLY